MGQSQHELIYVKSSLIPFPFKRNCLPSFDFRVSCLTCYLMKLISFDEARQLIEEPVSKRDRTIPDWFAPNHVRFLFPIESRPVPVEVCTPPLSPGFSQRTSVRREQDEARRKAMHNLVTNWDKSARQTSKTLLNTLFRGEPPPRVAETTFVSLLSTGDILNIQKYSSLIPDARVSCKDVLDWFPHPAVVPKISPISVIGGYTVTETVGPLSMLASAVRSKEQLVVWVKERVEFSHGRRKVRIGKRQGRVVLFDRHVNIVFIPRGNASDNWQFIRGSMIALIQRISDQQSSSNDQIQSSQSSRSVS